jgi:hypothetical protein
VSFDERLEKHNVSTSFVHEEYSDSIILKSNSARSTRAKKGEISNHGPFFCFASHALYDACRLAHPINPGPVGTFFNRQQRRGSDARPG